jgi:hypothetical protein
MSSNKILSLINHELRKNGNIIIPTNHPDNGLTKEDRELFKEIKKEVKKLLKKGQLVLVQKDRRLSAFERV